tara:strand:+ start:2581 stop:2913 length:333 start_codon:yes stop_codon:yes gene_type:complete
MKSKLGGHVAQIMYESAECGVTPDVKQVLYSTNNLPFHIMTHINAEKAILIGLMTDSDGSEVVKSYIINVNKWQWASTEGFNLSQIFNTNLYREVFEEIRPSQASSYLVN